MSYATQQDLVDRFGETDIIQLSDRANTGAIDAAVVAAKLADADAEIDGYLQQRYTLPLPSVPAALKRIACDLTRYHLDDRPSEYVGKRYDDAIAFLKMVAKGDVGIGVDPDGEAPAASSGMPEFDAPDRVFSHDSLKDFTQ